MENSVIILASVLQGLCASPEVSIRSPKSIAEKAVQITEAVEAVINSKDSKEE